MQNKLLTKLPNKKEKIAFICSACLGDALIAMVTVNNLVLHGYQIDVYGRYLYDLRAWFPWANIYDTVQLEQQKRLAQYPLVLHMYDSALAQQLSKWHDNSVVLSSSTLYKLPMSMVDIQVQFCEGEFGLIDVVRENNIRHLPGVVPRKYKKRIVVHPTSSLLRKNWPKNKFIRLAQKLAQEGYESHFIVAPAERDKWLDVVNCGIGLPQFATLSEVAIFVSESAFFIGNDSGIGHLASNLGVPTVSIILRKGVARQWRPTWAPVEVVLSPTWLNPRPLKEKLWKYFTTVNMVWQKFELLRKRCEAQEND